MAEATLTVKTKNPFWYLKHEDELQDVTSESSNPALGINRIHVIQASPAQLAVGIVAKVMVVTEAGIFNNISIEQSKSDPKALRVNLPAKKVPGKDGGKPQWLNDFTLTLKGKAQVLSYVSTLVEER